MQQVKILVPLSVLTPVRDENRQQIFSKEGEQLFLWQGHIHAAAKPTPVWSDYADEWDMLLWIAEEEM